MIKKLFSLLLIMLFTAGTLPFNLGELNPAEAKIKKVYRKAKAKKKVVRKKIKGAKKRQLRKAPVRSGIISQNYYLEEGADETEAENIAEELKSLGAQDAKVDIEKNTIQVKFDTKKLSAVTIIKRLKELGYTIKRID